MKTIAISLVLLAILYNVRPAIPKQATFCVQTGGTDIVDSDGKAFGCARYERKVR